MTDDNEQTRLTGADQSWPGGAVGGKWRVTLGVRISKPMRAMKMSKCRKAFWVLI